MEDTATQLLAHQMVQLDERIRAARAAGMTDLAELEAERELIAAQRSQFLRARWEFEHAARSRRA